MQKAAKNKKNLTTENVNSAKGISWDLSDLYASLKDENLGFDYRSGLKKARNFEKKYRGIFLRKPLLTSKELAKVLEEYEEILILRDKPGIFAGLIFAADTQNPEHGKLYQETQNQATEIQQHLIFFELEWCALDDKAVKTLISDSICDKYKHYLTAIRRYRPHLLSEQEEKIVSELETTGSRAFSRLFDEISGGATFSVKVDGKTKKLSLQETLAYLYDPDRKKRKISADALTLGFESNIKLYTFIFNILGQSSKTIDRLRNFPNPMDSRNLSNEIDQKTVDALLAACSKRYSLVQRYYRLKGKLLGLKNLFDYDRYAPLEKELPKVKWKEAKEIVLEAYHSFSPQLGDIVESFFKNDWIDAELRPGKRGGAFCAGATPRIHPYILVNFTERMRDVSTLAHELGHGVHMYLSREQKYLQYDTPLTVAETASVFGEMLTFKKLLERSTKPEVKLSLLCGKLEDAFATVFRQVCMTNFENKFHSARREKGELTSEQISDIWMQSNKKMFDDSVLLSKGYRLWWCYIPHFIHSPFYCYAYSFGELLVFSLYKMYLNQGKDFVPKYIKLLSSGGSESPVELMSHFGAKIDHPNFWNEGLDYLKSLLDEAEEVAEKILKKKSR
ncbi:MAG: M3 family oligoendopeptidase [Candidatus Riflebacteria bacterium]|nr:M3 family oligoendopeptidase [Candidatus Riflebacteria bacterium]